MNKKRILAKYIVLLSLVQFGACHRTNNKALDRANIDALTFAINKIDKNKIESMKDSERLKEILLREGLVTYWPDDSTGRPYCCEILNKGAHGVVVKLAGGEVCSVFEIKYAENR